MIGPPRLLATISVASVLLAGLMPAQAASLTVTVANLRSAAGHVRVGVCTKSEFLSEHCSYHAIVSAHIGSVSAVVDGIAPGTYAIAAYQDETDSGHLRRGLFGIPNEGSGFSRNPALRLGPPTFAQCALRLGALDSTITIVLHYF